MALSQRILERTLEDEGASIGGYAVLTNREMHVIAVRFGGHRVSLRDLGTEMHVTPQRIRQIEAKALRKMRRWERQHGRQASSAPGRGTGPVGEPVAD